MKIKVAFICVHNSCRSQMAEAIGNIVASEVFQCYSAGTKLKSKINQDAVLAIEKLYGINMNHLQYPKLLEELPLVDIIITMGCNVECPYIPSKYQEDWGLEDPTGAPLEEFFKVAKTIEEKVLDLKRRVETEELML